MSLCADVRPLETPTRSRSCFAIVPIALLGGLHPLEHPLEHEIRLPLAIPGDLEAFDAQTNVTHQDS